MKFPFFNPAPPPVSMTEADLLAGIRRCDATLAKQPGYMTAATAALIFGFGGGLLGAAILLTGMAGGAMLGIAAGVGVTACSAVGFTSKFIMTRAFREKNMLEEALPERVLARQQAEAESERLRNLAIAEKFNASVDAGLPLESAITVKRSLRLKTPPPESQHGFARAFSKVFGPVP